MGVPKLWGAKLPVTPVLLSGGGCVWETAPWSSGCLLVWDATCPDTFAISYRAQATSEAGRVAESAEDRKAEKYRGLPASHSFTPVAIETLGAIGPRSMLFLRDLGRRIALESGEPRSTDYLLQRLSVAV